MSYLANTVLYSLVVLVGSLLADRMKINRTVSFYARTVAYTIILLYSAFFGAVCGVVLGLFHKRGLAQWVTARVHYYLCVLFLQIRVEIEDPHNYLSTVRPAVFISNHQSFFDIFMLGATFPKWCSVTAKKALKWYPFLGWFMSASKTVFIDRASRTDALKAFDSARKEVLKDKQSIFMFPEGTRSNALTPMLLPFKKGAFHFAQQSGIPIVPYVVSNYSNIFSTTSLVARPGVIKVRVLEPIPTKDLAAKDVSALADKVRTKMLKAVEELGYATPL